MPSTPMLLKAKSVEEEIYSRIRAQLKTLSVKPTLATVLVGEDSGSQVYVRKKGEMCIGLGMGHRDFKLPATTAQKELLKIVDELNEDRSVHGILVQRPLPRGLDETEIFDRISAKKDVDCFSPENVGLLSQGRPRFLPCTPAGIMEIFRHYKIDIAGKNALVIGRSDIVGKPMSMLLLQANATVTIAHSRTNDLASHVAAADIVIAAIGRAKFLTADLPWKKSAVIIDVGMNRDPVTQKLCGDVDFEKVSALVSAITPVPGGVGPMTIAMLMQNTLRAALN